MQIIGNGTKEKIYDWLENLSFLYLFKKPLTPHNVSMQTLGYQTMAKMYTQILCVCMCVVGG